MNLTFPQGAELKWGVTLHQMPVLHEGDVKSSQNFGKKSSMKRFLFMVFEIFEFAVPTIVVLVYLNLPWGLL